MKPIVGGYAKLDDNELLLYFGLDLHCEYDFSEMKKITDITNERIGDDVYKHIWLETGELIIIGKNENYFYKEFAKIYPQTKIEWMQWIEPKEGMIGLELMNTPNGAQFERCIPGVWIDPMKWEEFRNGITYIHNYNHFARVIPNTNMNEYLICDHIQENNGETYILIMTGINFNNIQFIGE